MVSEESVGVVCIEWLFSLRIGSFCGENGLKRKKRTSLKTLNCVYLPPILKSLNEHSHSSKLSSPSAITRELHIQPENRTLSERGLSRRFLPSLHSPRTDASALFLFNSPHSPSRYFKRSMRMKEIEWYCLLHVYMLYIRCDSFLLPINPLLQFARIYNGNNRSFKGLFKWLKGSFSFYLFATSVCHTKATFLYLFIYN